VRTLPPKMNTMLRIGALLGLLALPSSSCALKGGTGSGGSSSTVLTAEEIDQDLVTTAYEAIQRYRPQWLWTRATPTPYNPHPTPPQAYLDGVRLEGVSELRSVRAAAVESIRYLSPTDATNRFGTDHMGGAILVTTR
jgi:hypothetical protein